MQNTQNLFEFPDYLLKEEKRALDMTREQREEVKDISSHNQKKVLKAFVEEKVSDYHFHGTTGYGFSDAGRETLDRVFARIFNTESAIVRHSIVSGTHALAVVLHGNLRPGDEIIMATGDPYDTIKPILGLQPGWKGGLDEWGIDARIIPLDKNDMPDIPAIIDAISEKTKMLFLQRSCGYTWRPSFSVKILGDIISAAKSKKKDIIVMIDNCYGEMVEKIEPTDLGADVMGGSLIKNMGGAIAPTGGCIVGRRDVVERASTSLTCAGIGGDEGATLGHNRLLFQGAFFAPHIVAESLEGAIWASCFLENMGFDVKPRFDDPRTDIIQGIRLGSREKQEVFCLGIQNACPVDSMAVPIAADLPGYRDPIIMAGGTFIQGASIELSCDGPIREPHAVYLQGGICFEHVRLGVMNAVAEMVNSATD
ncbi:MAG: methionine gamma-lyase family protein [Candidatus Eremiobacteraeota bacterium]|nr:methionine gamma-lyase family protein [Candidatus Eremiobacteraeota bacterium]